MPSSKLTEREIDFLRLVMRSNDCGNGWKSVSTVVWPLVLAFKRPELIDIHPTETAIRLSERGKIVAEYLI